MYPKKLTNFHVVIDGYSMAGVADEITLPVLSRNMVEHRAGGMLGPVSLDLGLEAMKVEITLSEQARAVLASWGLEDASGLGVRFMGAAESEDGDSSVDAIEVTVRGRWKMIDTGTIKPGETAKTKVEMPITYFKYTVNGTDLIEIDLMNNIEKVNGVDRMAAIRAAIGQAV